MRINHHCWKWPQAADLLQHIKIISEDLALLDTFFCMNRLSQKNDKSNIIHFRGVVAADRQQPRLLLSVVHQKRLSNWCNIWVLFNDFWLEKSRGVLSKLKIYVRMSAYYDVLWTLQLLQKRTMRQVGRLHGLCPIRVNELFYLLQPNRYNSITAVGSL